MHSYHKEATVGALVLVALAAFVGGTLWLRGKSIGKPELNVVFADIGNLKEGAPVRISGAPVGRVEEIVFEGVGKVRVGVIFSQDITPAETARASIGSIGMLGDAVINLDPGQGAPLPKGATIVGTTEVGLFDKGAELADQASLAMTSLNKMLDTALVIELKQTLASSQRLLNYYADSKQGPTAELGATMRALRTTSARLDSTLVGIDAPALQARLDTTMRSAGNLSDRLAATSARVDSMLARIERGEGTLGKLASDTLLYGDLRRTMKATAELVDEIKKNPGKLGITVRVF
ncbi:MAG: MlaD family protein [Gemmatimonadales bacterium]|nr:MlaD family protein [Gemmatimonadales bacterium]